MFKRLCCFICVLAFTLTLSVSISASNEASFSLSDIVTNKNRLFDSHLSVNCEVAAFVAEISYNPAELRFDGAKALNSNAQLSVNNNQSGDITIAYLCEEGASGDLIKLSFKSYSFDSSVALEVSQVIDKNGSDITVSASKGAFVEVSVSSQNADAKPDKNADKNTETTLSHKETSVSQNSFANEITLSSPRDDGKLTLISIGVSVAAVLGIGAVAFYLGRKSGRKNK